MTASVRAGFGPSVELADLGTLGAPMGSPGQCLSVRPLQSNPNLLVKQYRPGQLTEQDEARLERLVAWPDGLADPRGAEFLLGGSAWPLSRVTSGQHTVGVLMSLAPDRFYERVKDPYGSQRIVLTLDHVAAPNDDLRALGLKVLDRGHRLRVCAGILAMARFLERFGLVYGDWGYQNVMWSRKDLSVYFIDMDACSFGGQRWVESFGFEDPLTPSPEQVDRYTERYRCSVMAAACLTGTKEPAAALSALAALAVRDRRLRALEQVIRANVTASDRTGRAPISELCAALPHEVRVAMTEGEGADEEWAASSGVGESSDAGANIERWESISEAAPTVKVPRQSTAAPTVKVPKQATAAARAGTATSTRARRATPEEQKARSIAAGFTTALIILVFVIIVLAQH